MTNIEPFENVRNDRFAKSSTRHRATTLRDEEQAPPP